MNPTTGDTSSDFPASSTLVQGIVTHDGSSQYITRDTQRIEPMSVCELDAGIPRYQVQKFHIIADTRSDSTTQIQNVIG